MREIDFLPSWYPELHRRRRLLMLQGWCTLILATGLALWLLKVNRNKAGAEGILSQLSNQIVQTDVQLQQMEQLRKLEAQLQQQQEVQSKLGLHVEAARLIGKLDSLMPRGMALLNLKFETEEKMKEVMGLAAAALTESGKGSTPERRMKVYLSGVAPTDVDVANFITKLTQVPFFDSVNMNYVRDRRDGNYLMRQFELTFFINLNMPSGS